MTILTSNRTRELNDAVKRRCLYHWLDYPERERELAIVRARVPQAGEALSRAGRRPSSARLRSQPFANAFQRAPGIAESVEWAKALVALDTLALDPEVVADTAGILFKQREDVAALTRELAAELLKPEARGRPERARAMQLGDARSGKLADNIAGFGRALRRAGVRVDSARIALAAGGGAAGGRGDSRPTSAPRWRRCWSAASRTAACSASCSTPSSATPSMAHKLLAQMLPQRRGQGRAGQAPPARERGAGAAAALRRRAAQARQGSASSTPP